MKNHHDGNDSDDSELAFERSRQGYYPNYYYYYYYYYY